MTSFAQSSTPNDEGRNIVTATGKDVKVITTDFRQGTVVAVVLPPADFSEALQYTNDFYEDGRIQRSGDEDGETQTISLAAGESRRIGEWLWGAGPLALIGVRVND